jgi:hypothetical protein
MSRRLDQPITARQRNQLKKLILRCLTEDFDYGRSRKTGKPLKRRHRNQAIFDGEKGYQVFSGTDLDMVMERVALGLSFGMEAADDRQ